MNPKKEGQKDQVKPIEFRSALTKLLKKLHMAERVATSPSPMLEENLHVWLCTLSLNTIRSYFYREPQTYFQRIMKGFAY